MNQYMLQRLMSFINKNITICLLMVISIIFIIPYSNPNFFVAQGESSIYLNPGYLDYYTTWENRLNDTLGISSFQSNILLYSVFWSVFKLAGSIINPPALFLFVSCFLSGLFLYFCLDHLLRLKNKLVYLPACLLYSYNVFRLLGPLNERLNLLFVFIPLFFLFYYKLLYTRKWKYVFIVALISLVSSSMGANLPVFFIPYLMMLFTFFIFALLGKFSGMWKDVILKNVSLLILIILENLFWMIPLAISLTQVYNETNQGAELWKSTGAGTFFDHFRFLGSWAWHGGNGGIPYYKFAGNYDKFFLIFTTYLITFISLLYLLNRKSNKYSLVKKVISVIFVTSFLLLAGNKGALGFIFDFLYEKVPLFKMYREPFAKFTPLFILSMAFTLTFSLDYVRGFLDKKYFNYVILFVSFLVLINAYPFFNGESIPAKNWNNGKNDFLIKVPEYWMDMKYVIEKRRLDDNLAIFPYNTYGTSYNWEYGASLSGNVADYLINRRLIRAWDIDNTNLGLIMKSVFNYERNLKLPKILGVMNVNYILQENDLEWRYSVNKIKSPLETNELMKKNELMSKYESGHFDLNMINNVFNVDKEKMLSDEVKSYLLNNSILIYYKLSEKNFLPHFYTPVKNIVSGGEIDDLIDIVSREGYETRSAIFFEYQNKDKKSELSKLGGENKGNQIVEFRKINPTKYRLRIHNVTKDFPLVFSESFHEQWRAYLVENENVNAKESNESLLGEYKILDGNKEDQASFDELRGFVEKGLVTDLGDGKEKQSKHYKWNGKKEIVDYVEKYKVDFVSKNFNGTIQNDNLPKGKMWETWLAGGKFNNDVKQISENKHLMANGYANSWMMNVDELCGDGKMCQKNADGSYDMEVVVEFWPQRLFYVGLAISGFTLFGCLGYLGYDWRKRRREMIEKKKK